MKEIANYIDELKEKYGSDYRAASVIGVDRTVYSNFRKRNAVSDENAIKIAKALGVEEMELLIAAAVSRSTGAVKEAWKKAADCILCKIDHFKIWTILPSFKWILGYEKH